MTIRTIDHSTVTLKQCVGNDLGIVEAALASSDGVKDLPTNRKDLRKKMTGLINYLTKHRHGSPFEHNSMTFHVQTPIFVARQFQRHRIGFSYNETSGRYRVMEDVFYVPDYYVRPMVNVGTPARPKMGMGTYNQQFEAATTIESVARHAFEEYKALLDLGVATEVARMVLPLNTMTEFYVTLNLRAAFNFLSLRVHDKAATFESHPQWEIEDVARQIEDVVATHFPIAYAAFVKNGRVAP